MLNAADYVRFGCGGLCAVWMWRIMCGGNWYL